MKGGKRDKPERPAIVHGVRDRILDAALGILRESGIQRLTQVNVAERAGVRQSHLTYYFPTRRDLLHAVVARGVDGAPYEDSWEIAEDETGPDELIERVAAAVSDAEHMRLFVAMIVEADDDPALRAMLIEATRRFETTLADALGGVEARDRARHLVIALWGLGLYHFALRPSGRNDPTGSFLDYIRAAMGEATAGPEGARRRRGRGRGKE